MLIFGIDLPGFLVLLARLFPVTRRPGFITVPQNFLKSLVQFLACRIKLGIQFLTNCPNFVGKPCQQGIAKTECLLVLTVPHHLPDILHLPAHHLLGKLISPLPMIPFPQRESINRYRGGVFLLNRRFSLGGNFRFIPGVWNRRGDNFLNWSSHRGGGC